MVPWDSVLLYASASLCLERVLIWKRSGHQAGEPTPCSPWYCLRRNMDRTEEIDRILAQTYNANRNNRCQRTDGIKDMEQISTHSVTKPSAEGGNEGIFTADGYNIFAWRNSPLAADNIDSARGKLLVFCVTIRHS